MSDTMIRATAADGSIRAFAVYSKDMVEKARSLHNTSPVATAALGRMMSAGAMMGSMMKSDNDLLTMHIKGIGPMKGVTISANNKGQVKGYVDVPDVIVPAKNSKLDVGGAIGQGYLIVIKDMGLKEPYTGRIQLQSGEIADDLTYYYAVSEQIPSSVALGVLMDKDNHVKVAGGFIIQLMPNTPDDIIDALESKLNSLKPITSMLDEGMMPKDILEYILGDMNLKIEDEMPISFYCNCSKGRIEKVLLSLSKEDMDDMIDKGEPIEVKCHFCNTAYEFSTDDLKKLRISGAD